MAFMNSIRAASVLALSFVAVSADAITYTASRPVGTGTVDLSITTDGTLGVLTNANLVGWSITVTEGADSFTLVPGNSASLMGAGVSATSTDLSFDFGSGDLWLIQTPTFGSGDPFWCVQSDGCFDFSGPAEGILPRFSNFNSYVRQPYSGVQVIASAVIPEPASWAMLIAGFGLVGTGLRRGRRLATA